MSKQKFVVTSDTRVKGNPAPAGTILDLDPKNADDSSIIGQLGHANRLLDATDENIKAVKAAIEDRKKAKSPKGKAATAEK